MPTQRLVLQSPEGEVVLRVTSGVPLGPLLQITLPDGRDLMVAAYPGDGWRCLPPRGRRLAPSPANAVSGATGWGPDRHPWLLALDEVARPGARPA